MRFKELHYRCECYRAVLIVAGSLRVLGNKNDGGQLETFGVTDKERLKITVNIQYLPAVLSIP